MASVVRLPTQPTQLFKRVIQTWGAAQFSVTTPVVRKRLKNYIKCNIAAAMEYSKEPWSVRGQLAE